MATTTYTKDPDAKLDYEFDFATSYLDSGETISSYAVTADDGLTVSSSPAVSESSGVVTYWLEGGTAGQVYRVTCRITTSAGRTDDRSVFVRVEDQ